MKKKIFDPQGEGVHMLKKILALVLSVLCVLSCMTVLAGARTTEEIAKDNNHVSESKSSHDPKELAQKINNKLEHTAHPYILYTEDDIPALREKAQSGLSKKSIDRVMVTAEAYMKKTISVNSGASGIAGRRLQSYVTYLTVAGIISGNNKYIQKAVELTVSAAEQGNTEIYLSINDALCIGDFGHAYALAYDWLYNSFTEEQRALVRAELEEIGEWIYTKSPVIDTWGSQLDRRKAWNWNVVTHGALGLISLALGDKQDWLALSIRRVTDYYDLAVDDTGAAMEGLHYIGYGLNSCVPFDGAIYKLMGIELMDDYPELQMMPAWSMLYMTLPQGGRQAAIGQTDGMGNYNAPYYIINRYGLAEELWGFEHTFNLGEDGEFNSEYEGNGWSCPSIIFYEDQSLTSTPPTSEKFALTKEFAKGLVISRDSWEKDAAMLTFTSGVGFAGCWNHPDDNTFTFSAKGDAFVVDLGAGKLSSAEHNVVQIDGVGMSYEGGATMMAGDIQENTTLENGNLYLRGSNLSSYRHIDVKSSIRQLVFSGGDVPFVLIYDYMRKDGATHTYNTNFYIDNGNKIEVSPNGRYAIITGRNSGAECYMFTGATDFVFVESEGNRITTETESTILCQATIFIMANPDGSMPEVDFEGEGKNFTVTVTRQKGGEDVTETYVFGLDELQDFSTTEELTPPDIGDTETESATQVETEVKETESSTEAKETEPVTESDITEKATEEEKATEGTESATDDNKVAKKTGGCSAVVGTAILPTAIVSAVFIARKKKKQ